jgi:hypothetical protein
MMCALETTSQWRDFLRQHAGAENLCGSATEEQLDKAEAKLKIKFPPSYRAFLVASNGLKNASRAVPVLKPVDKLKWFKREHKDWVEAYTAPMQGMDLPLPAEQDYFNYSSDDRGSFDASHLAHTLSISEIGDDAVLLLNPMVIWPDGEWEAWFFANWVPGAVRYRSFAEWMCHEAADQGNEPYVFTQTPGELPTVYRDGPAKAKRRIRPREEVLTLEEIRQRLKSEVRSRRIKAVQCLARMKGPEIVAILLDLFKNDYDFHVRCEVADAFGKLQAPEAIPPLIEEASEYSRVSGSAIHAMARYKDEQTAQCLIKLVEDNSMSAAVAAHILAIRKDARGVKPLVDILLSQNPKDQHTGGISARLIAPFEEAGFAALEPLANHPEDTIRQRALGGISDIAGSSKSKELRAKALKVLEESLAREAGGQMHQWLATCVAVAGGKVAPLFDNPFAG